MHPERDFQVGPGAGVQKVEQDVRRPPPFWAWAAAAARGGGAVGNGYVVVVELCGMRQMQRGL